MCLFLFAQGLSAQVTNLQSLPITTEGTDFWVAYPRMTGTKIDDASLSLYVMITSSSEEELEVVVAHGATDEEMTRLTIPAGGGYAEYMLTPKSDPMRAYIDQSESPFDRGLHIYTPQKKIPFSCYAYAEAGTVGASARDAALLLPQHTYGKEYLVQTYPQDGKCTEFAVVATEDNTMVNIVPSANTFNGVPAGGLIQMRLNRGQTLMVSSKQNEEGKQQRDTMDLSGSTICADKPVAVFGANEALKVPMNEAYSDDYTFEQIPPLTSFGTEFYVGRSDRQNMFCCVTALYDNTEVTEYRYNANTQRVALVNTTLQAGQSLSVKPPLNMVITNIVIRSTQPVLCYTYFSSAAVNAVTEYDDSGNPKTINWSDPSNAMLTSWEQRVTDMTFYTKTLNTTLEGDRQFHYVQVTVPKAEIGLLQLDGAAVDAAEFKTYGGNDKMAYASLPVAESGKHQLTTTGEGFIGFIYGFADGMSYLYTLGYRPNAHPDSLFIAEEDNIMSRTSYDLNRKESGWYQRQLKEWPASEQRLDTAVVCDSTLVHFLVKADRSFESYLWEIWDILPDTMVLREEVADDAKLQYWEHMMAVAPDRGTSPELRKPFTDYEVRGIPLRSREICPEDSIYGDTLRTVVRVLRSYNDTVRRIICTGDTVRFFYDSVFAKLPNLSEKSVLGNNDSTEFVGSDILCRRGEDRQITKHRYACGLGFHRFARLYQSQSKCDSIVVFEIYVNPSPDTTLIEDYISHDKPSVSYPRGDNVMFSGQTFSRPGVYLDHLTALNCEDAGFDDPLFHGCDSVIKLRLHLRDTVETFFCDTTDSPSKYKVDWGNFVWTGHLTDKDGNDLQVRDVTTNRTIWAKDIANVIKVGETHEFHDYYKTSDGCDSNYVLVLTREPVEIIKTVINRPNNLPYTWHYSSSTVSGQRTYTPNETWKDTTVYDTVVIKNVPGICPVIFLLEVTFREIKMTLREENKCDVDTVMWRGKIYAGYRYKEKYPNSSFTPKEVFNNGFHEVLVDSFKTSPKREYYDSLFYLELRISPSFTRYDTLYLCDNETVKWNGMVFAGAKSPTTEQVHLRFPAQDTKYDYKHVFPTQNACDSTCYVTFFIRPSFLFEEEVTICANEDYVWTDHSTSGRPMYDALTGERVAFGRGRLWNNQTEATFVLTDSLRTTTCRECAKGSCDSVYRLTLHVHPVYGPITLDTVVCRSEQVFVWEGHTDKANPSQPMRFYESVTGYRDTLRTIHNCDSITMLNLRFFDDDLRSYTRSVCVDAEAFVMGTTGVTFSPKDSTIGVHYFSTYVHSAEADHCPYKEEWTVRVMPVYSGETNAAYRTEEVICQDTVNIYYEWVNHYYKDGSTTEVRTLYDTEGKAVPADSILINKVGEYVYYDRMQTLTCADCAGGGCDSIWVLHLTVNPTYYHAFRYMMSEEETYEWEGVVYGGQKTQEPHDVVVTKDTIIESHHAIGTGDIKCDSTVVLRLRVGKVYRDTTYDFVCDNCTYTWRRELEDGTDTVLCEDVRVPAGETHYYYDAFETYLEFDSVFVLALTGMPTYYLEESDSVCQDLTDYQWFGHSAATHRLFQDNKQIDRISLLDTGWYHITDSMTTRAMFVDPHGVNTRVTACDSVWTLHLYVKPSYNAYFNSDVMTDEDALCSNETYIWHRILYVGSDFDNEANSLPDPTLYDEVVRLTESDLTKGLIRDSIMGQTYAGCDSILYLNLNLNRSPFLMRYDTIGDNDTIWTFGHGDHIITGRDFHVSDYTDPTREIRKFFYIDTLTTIHGCDSIVHDSLVVAPSYRFVADTTTCSTDRLDWRKYNEMNYLPSGIYYDSLHTYYYHVDSTYVLDLTVIPNFNSHQVQRMCKNDTLDWQHKKIYYEPANENAVPPIQYTATYVKPGACDSTYELDVYYYNYYHLDAQVDSVCRYDDYHWFTDGTEHTTALYDEQHNRLFSIPTDTLGWITVYDSLHTQNECGCDSTFTLHLYVKPAYHFYDTIDICSNETAYWHNREYSSPTATVLHDEINYGTIVNCDSVYYLTVNVHQAYYFDDTDVICASALPYVWQGHKEGVNLRPDDALTWLNDSTFYLSDSCVTVYGCDSIYNRQVTVVPIRHTWESETICEGDTLVFNRYRLTTAGTYTDTLVNQWGCDSIVTMQLSTVPLTHFNVQPQASICADDAAFDVNYKYVGLSPVAYSITFSDEALTQGFVNVGWTSLSQSDDVITVSLPPYSKRTDYVRPNNYTATICFDNGICLDSTLMAQDISFSLRYPSWLLEQHWNDAIGVLVDSLNGGYHFTNFQWYKNNEIMYGETRPYLYCPQYLEEDALYSVALTRSDDSLTFFTCELVPDLSRPQTVTPEQPYIAVVPTLVVKENPVVNILSVTTGDYAVYDELGTLCTSGRFTPGAHNAYEVRLPATSGVYIFHLSEATGLNRAVKVIVR